MTGSLKNLQNRLRRAVTGGDDTVLALMLDGRAPAHISPARRIAVHTGNFYGSLGDALAAAFPVVRQLVGERFFAAAAHAFVEAEPPPRPDLASYGGGFSAFLDAFPPAAEVPYLGDVARLEWARVEATFAADADPIDPERLGGLSPSEIAGLRFVTNPSLRLIGSTWAIQTIWEAHQSEPVIPCDPASAAEQVMIVRSGERLLARRLTVGSVVLLASLAMGEHLDSATAAAMAIEEDFDLQVALATLLNDGVFVGCQPGASGTS